MTAREFARSIATEVDLLVPLHEVVPHDVVLGLIQQADRAEVDDLAATYVVNEIRSHRRWLVQKAEQRAEQKARAEEAKRQAEAEKARLAKLTPEERRREKFKHGSLSKYNGGAYHGCTCGKCQKARERNDRIDQRFHERTAASLAQYAAELRIEWTRELLGSSFALPSGELVRWGEATVEQHQARVAMLTRNAEANLEAAGRHLRAVSEITDAGVLTLADLQADDLDESA